MTVLVIDGDAVTADFVRRGLSAPGYALIHAANGQAGLDLITRHAPDVIVLDIALPDMRGLDIIRTLRRMRVMTPLIVLSREDHESTKVAALDLGADDYVTKPVGLDEFRARVRTALRHRLRREDETQVFRTGALSVDLARRVVTVRDERVRLSPREYDLLRLLVKHAGKVLTHNFIQTHVWSREIGVQYVRIYIRALRLKLEEAPDMPRYILTELGVGYRLRAPE